MDKTERRPEYDHILRVRPQASAVRMINRQAYTQRRLERLGLVLASSSSDVKKHSHEVDVLLALATSDLNPIGTSASDIVGATLTLPSPGTIYLVTGVFDFDWTVAPAATAAAGILTDAANVALGSSSAAILFGSIVFRATVIQQWRIQPTSANYVVKLRAFKTAASGTAIARATNTSITAAGNIARR